MPVIQAKFSLKLTKEQKTELQRGCGAAISAIAGKSEQVLMVCVEDELALCFGGVSEQPAAYFQVQVKGDAPREEYQEFIARLSGLSERVSGVPAGRTFISIDPAPYWSLGGRLLP